jgi:hypothetical protein
MRDNLAVVRHLAPRSSELCGRCLHFPAGKVAENLPVIPSFGQLRAKLTQAFRVRLLRERELQKGRELFRLRQRRINGMLDDLAFFDDQRPEAEAVANVATEFLQAVRRSLHLRIPGMIASNFTPSSANGSAIDSLSCVACRVSSGPTLCDPRDVIDTPSGNCVLWHRRCLLMMLGCIPVANVHRGRRNCASPPCSASASAIMLVVVEGQRDDGRQISEREPRRRIR